MDKKKSQHYNFVHEALPILFHSQTKDFMHFIEEDSTKFLKFWWNHVGERLPAEQARSFEGMSCEVRQIPEKKATAVLIRFPPPREFDEFYMAVLIKTPERHMFMTRIPNTKFYSLSYVPLEKSETGTMIYYLTPRGRYLPQCPGPRPSKEAFYDTVMDLVWKKKKGKAKS